MTDDHIFKQKGDENKENHQSDIVLMYTKFSELTLQEINMYQLRRVKMKCPVICIGHNIIFPVRQFLTKLIETLHYKTNISKLQPF